MNDFLPVNPLITRAFWALIIIASGLVFYWLLNRAIFYRARKNNANHSSLSHPGIPAILYFTTPDCIACKTVQRPALYRLQEHLGDRLQVVEINAQEQPDLAARWGVLSVPTTFVIDQHGQLRHVNHGVTRADRLLQQLETVTGGAISSRT